MRHRIDPELARWLPVLPDLSYADVAAARDLLRRQVRQWPAFRPDRPVESRQLTVAGPAGAPPVPVRVYTPAGVTDPLPAMLYLHGGGFVTGDLESVHASATYFAAELCAVVVSVGYRLAPEDPFPAGVEDCYAALTWLSDSAPALQVDPTRIAVAGSSAGGGLAAALALLARDRTGPPLCFQYLETPMLDDRMATPSMRQYLDTPMLNRRNADLSWHHYLDATTSPGAPRVSPYAAPARAEDLSDLPPACVIACEFDPLRDEALCYGQRLVQSGVPTEMHLYPATFHGSTIVIGAAITRRMATDRLATLRRALTP
ncbi:MAG TPA: alpha/beta hydrolase [Actinophytocola sp.]|uniref:alpha/beta hydrolase n=1 Tax=Actinophytocola sp. TaxID=1872138 RepID=UPI002DBF8AA8|nr:alpha/beta hydrolase [Actinophytocola sp.]HEU5469677.1 alpha/beta hydrolase [Actinophytocola sp.]